MIARWDDEDFENTVEVNSGSGWRNPAPGELPFQESYARVALAAMFLGALLGAVGFWYGSHIS